MIGLYVDPPEKSVVLCCDEQTQCQELERTQPGLPLGNGQIRTRTLDSYRQHGGQNSRRPPVRCSWPIPPPSCAAQSVATGFFLSSGSLSAAVSHVSDARTSTA